MRDRADSDSGLLDWRLGSAYEGPVLFIRENDETPRAPQDLHGLVLFMRAVGERHPVVLSAQAPLDQAVGRRAEEAGLFSTPRPVKDEKMVAGQTNMHIRVDALPP